MKAHPPLGIAAATPPRRGTGVSKALWGALGAGAVAAMLAAVFLAWLNPHLMLALANQAWACF
jgi:hypothetical protein